ncbi:ribosomal protein S18-alanine N-acetyltransferase [Listeria fleischmannii]|uniref:[Ribosomal protein bS18]-alanine N-acetyltransferase n=1 Tax=Listeria fleischmannii FSL S10-1203 TaxID=1265822 RepID=W7DGB6_9LIST|nr:ribosomal protein S18-alanine N-acetyltransferase [Listeria fleischmannii]EUJ59227.1 ribosomal-protein-alanine acetyltransferase [Listeria fleischmannii FSL S10-1203]MBC1419545.1 ribosomal protein S18-alanine N-acetyltransferase [Listeria fleischmannii]
MISFRKAGEEDIDALLQIEHAVFSSPWSREAFLNEFKINQYAHYLLAVLDGEVVGYGGVWLVLDEGHVTNIAIHPDFQGNHYGEALLVALLDLAKQSGVTAMTLEVRVTNTRAQNLYRKYNFQNGAIRKRYYPDNGEDALVMWVNLL